MLDRIRMRRLWAEAIRKSNLPLGQKLMLRTVLALNSDALDAVNDFVAEKAQLVSVTDFNAMADGKIIELLLQYLPEIIELIKLIIGLF
jgi:hypothetical protein